MSVNKRAKGNAFQVWIKAWLEERGWQVLNFPVRAVPVMGRGGKPLMKNGKMVFRKMDQDVWGADLIAKRVARGMRRLWIQASEDSGVAKRVEEFKKHWEGGTFNNEYLHLWIKSDNGAINVKEVIPETWEAIDLGKIIRRKWYPVEGSGHEF